MPSIQSNNKVLMLACYASFSAEAKTKTSATMHSRKVRVALLNIGRHQLVIKRSKTISHMPVIVFIYDYMFLKLSSLSM